jgi:outer membrane protein OmpA-like peptidoglycan-associated protein
LEREVCRKGKQLAAGQDQCNSTLADVCPGDTVKAKLLLAVGITLSLSAFAQTNAQTTMAVEPMAHTPTFRVAVTSRSVQAVNYKHRGGATKLDFAGTDLMPGAHGQAKVESKKGYIEIEVEFGNLQKPTTFGNEYLTYILWAISPEGRAVNLGEILVGDNSRSKLDVTTDLQAFALVVTAEPYYAVRQPSNVVVLENVIREDTKGTTEAMSTKYELLERGGYIPTGYKFDPVVLNTRLPLEFFEARNALRIAQSEGAETYANDTYQQTVQVAEDARAITVKRIDQERLDNERQAAANAQAQTQAQADDATRQKEKAQSDQARAELATAQAESDAARARTDTANAQSAAAKARADMADSQTASANALSAAQADADQSRMAAQQAQLSAQQAEADKAAMRTRLSEQLNKILQTRDSARGLIVSMSDVLFDTGKYSLKAGAREKLAKVAGILLAYPGLNIEVGGYTDNVGGDQMNQTLSENRAGSVRDYLVQGGVARNSVSAKGFGNTLPVATNDNSAGRQQNRRVELVVSGEAIGNPVNAITGSLR